MLHSNRVRSRHDREPSIHALFPLQQSLGESFLGGAVVTNIVTLGVAGYGQPFIIYATCGGQEDQLPRLVETAMVAYEPWRLRVTDRFASTDLDTLQETADAAFSAVRDRGPESIDLRSLSPADINGEHLAVFLRCLFSWRDVVPGWHQAVEVAANALNAEGKKPKSVLYGLM